MSANIMVLGATGETGRALCPLLLDHTGASLVLAGRDGQALARAAARLERPERVSTHALDARDPRALGPALAGVDLVLVVAPLTDQLPAVARAAAAAGADLLDIQYSPAKVKALRALEPELVAAGRTVITDGGFHPGLVAVLARAVEDRFEVLHSARIGSVIQENWRALAPTRESMIEFVDMLGSAEAGHFRNGQWARESWSSGGALTHFTFDPPFGRRTCYTMALDEVRLWAEGRPDLQDAGFYVAGFNPVVDHLMIPLMMVGRKLAPVRSRLPLARLLAWGLRTFARPPYATVLRLEASGERDGRPLQLALTVSHPSSYAMTAMPVAATVRQWLAGSAHGPGLRLQALAVEPHQLLADMAAMGAAVIEGAPVTAEPVRVTERRSARRP